MSDTERDEELDAIREQKAAELSERAASPAEPVHVESPDHLQELVGDGVTLVDFHAEWCGPCKMLAPIVEEIAADTDATVAKVDIDQLRSVAQQYQVQGVPTVYLFANGEPVQRWVGVQDKGTYVSAIEAAA
ncbi:thioredoxin [Salinirubellus salinus]|jgi:thioredoxin 1|uniref:Thioredoxin n=1 Tax=Salinirubellus salinus TaxID=1364945 RepID=A0A9E7R4I3_9EURY|nr:thioredoxin [Salinirubellus salinus]UWM55716.1 thioredoxin [Salinirubellus salinus]